MFLPTGWRAKGVIPYTRGVILPSVDNISFVLFLGLDGLFEFEEFFIDFSR